MGLTLYEKIWRQHVVQTLPSSHDQLFIGLHLIHEVTSPQAFGMLKEQGLKVAYPQRTFATVDHIIPTKERSRPLKDPLAEEMLVALEANTKEHGITYFGPESSSQGIVHVIGPQLGLTQPGMTIACGDSHTATHGAFGAIAFGIGTSQVRDVLASQTLKMEPLKVRQIKVVGKLAPFVGAKDLILHIIGKLGAKGGVGYAYEYAGPVIDSMSMQERMTLCNMSIEGGARSGYVNPDETTFSYLEGKPYAPKGADFEAAKERWLSYRSDDDASYDDVVVIDASKIEPTLTYGVSPDQSIAIDEMVPSLDEGDHMQEALSYMKLKPNEPIKGLSIDVAFIGSCTNGRLEDFDAVARHIGDHKVAEDVRAICVPGSYEVDKLARENGTYERLVAAGFEWRKPGCSMCLAMNPDKLVGDEVCASTSNRNFKGRQGSVTGRTILMSPVMVAASAVAGKVADPREVF